MSNGSANLQVWVGEDVVCIRIAGRATFQSSVDFKTLVTSLWQQGKPRFILELSECQLMDSTFLGIMAGLGLKFASEQRVPNSEGAGRRATLELLNASARVLDLLDNLGISHLFQLLECPPPQTGQLSPVPPAAPTAAGKLEISKACLEAHRLLMEINPNNVPKFKDVTRFLEEDLKRQG